MVNRIKNFLSGNILYNIDKQLIDLQGVLFDISKQYPKENNLQHRLSNINALLQQIKQAFGTLNYELKQLYNDVLYLQSNRRDRRT